MYLFDIGWEVLKWAWENRDKTFTLASLLTLLGVLIDKFGRKLITNQLKRLFHVEDKSEFSKYVANQKRIESKVDMLLEERGLIWVAPLSQTSQLPNATDGRKNSLLRSWMGRLHAVTIGGYTWRMEPLDHSKTKRGNTAMKKWLKPDTLTIFAGIITAAITRYFNVEIDPTNIIAAALILFSYFKAHEYVTIVRDANGLPSGFKINSRKFIFTAVAFAIVVADELMTSIEIPIDVILLMAGSITGFNFVEAKKDAKQAEVEGAKGYDYSGIEAERKAAEDSKSA